jgi:hypothetical protein
MTTDPLLERLRAADPGPLVAIEEQADLFQHIVSSPGDSRLLAGQCDRGHAARHRVRRWLRIGQRPLPLLSALVIVTGAAAATTGVIGLTQLEHATPRKLFIANPAHMFPHAPNQTVIPQTVSRAATFTVPGAGRFEFWIARSRKGWLCEAIRQPDRTWADLGTRGDRYQISGPVPGCEGVPWQDKEGFSYYPTTISTRQGGWRIVYGYAPATGHPVMIRDRLSGATAPIGDGRYFAIIIPLCKRAGCMRRLTFPTHYFQLETLNAVGRVLIRNEVDPGN